MNFKRPVPPTKHNLPVLLTAQEAADVLKLSVGHLANDRVGKRKIPFVKVGARICYRESDILKLINEGLHGAQP